MKREIKELEELEDFKRELKDLLLKYNASIDFNVGPGSDTWGIYDEEMAVYFKKHNRSVKLADGMVLDVCNLK